MVHGDYKISNLFVNVDKSKSYTIDWQWMGGGCPATDVAYFIYTSTVRKKNEKNTDPKNQRARAP